MEKARKHAVSPTAKTRVFLVDDHAIIRHGMAQLLGKQDGIEIVGEAAGAPEAISGISETEPDLIICDLSLSEGGGLELIKDVKARWPNIKVLVSSMHNDATYVERAMRAGALGYVTKEQPHDDLVDAVSQVLRGKIYVCPELSDTIMQRALQGEEGLQTSAIDQLSDRELQVFELIGEGLSTRQIAENLSLSVKTIETYRDNIKQKLSLASGSELVHRAIRWKLERETGAV